MHCDILMFCKKCSGHGWPLVPYLNNFLVDCHEVWYRYLWSEAESLRL